MLVKFSILLFLLILLGGGWYFLISRQPAVANFPTTKQGPVMVYGDSLAAGVGASPGNDLASQMSRALNQPVLNFGVAGDTTALGWARLPQALEEEPKLVLLILGGNDFLKKVPREETFQNLERIITAFQKGGAIVVVAGVRSGIMGRGAESEYRAVVRKTKAAYIEDILEGVFGKPSLMSDPIHPNDEGYAVIARRVIPVIQKLLLLPT